ncbi:MAG: ChaN family lipoprotein [Flammeovirgaceae bacterium]
MKYFFLLLTILFGMNDVNAQDKPAYKLYDKNGKSTSYKQMLKKLEKADVILFGELHNNPICHWLQTELAIDLEKKHKQKLVLAAEMFEADDQLVLSEYIQGKIKESHLKSESKVWNNYDTDYAPLVELAKAKKLHFVASNIPRRYANMVARLGLTTLDSLPAEAKRFIAPLPISVDMSLPGYQKMLEMMKGHAGMAGEQFVHAQAIKDATMAHFIVENWDKGKQVLHFNGAFHSNNFEGIFWYLKKVNPKLNIVTISSVEQESVMTLDETNKDLADFIITIPSLMTKTY